MNFVTWCEPACSPYFSAHAEIKHEQGLAYLPHKKPMPVGPHILCADATIQSAPIA